MICADPKLIRFFYTENSVGVWICRTCPCACVCIYVYSNDRYNIAGDLFKYQGTGNTCVPEKWEGDVSLQKCVFNIQTEEIGQKRMWKK